MPIGVIAPPFANIIQYMVQLHLFRVHVLLSLYLYIHILKIYNLIHIYHSQENMWDKKVMTVYFSGQQFGTGKDLKWFWAYLNYIIS